MFTRIIAIASIIIWSTVSLEFVKPSKENNRGRIITLMSVGSLLTIILTISLFRNTQF